MWKYLPEGMENDEKAKNILNSFPLNPLNIDFLGNGRAKKDIMIIESIRRKFGI